MILFLYHYLLLVRHEVLQEDELILHYCCELHTATIMVLILLFDYLKMWKFELIQKMQHIQLKWFHVSVFFSRNGFVSYIDGLIIALGEIQFLVKCTMKSSTESSRINLQIKLSFSPLFLSKTKSSGSSFCRYSDKSSLGNHFSFSNCFISCEKYWG